MQKIYIASDMEGIAGCVSWNEVNSEKSEYSQFQNIWTAEANLICNLLKNNYDEILYHDGHWNETNIFLEELPENVNLIRGNNGRGLTGLDDSFDAVMLHGYHSAGGTNLPLSHTFTDEPIKFVKLNDEFMGETTFAILQALNQNIPVVYISGDELAIEEAKRFVPNIVSTTTKFKSQSSYICKSPKKVLKEIETDIGKVLELLKNNKKTFEVKKPSKFKIEIKYTSLALAIKFSNYPGAKLCANNIVLFNAENLKEFFSVIKVCI